MKNKILKKLRSQTGASITFALLLFLVCAVLCSVILAAATAAAGRMSRIAETDQRYYAVTSAAELLKDVFKAEPTVSVVKVEETPVTTTYVSGVPQSSEKGSTVTTVYLVKKKGAEISAADLVSANVMNPDMIDTIQKDAAVKVYNYVENGTGLPLENGTISIAAAEKNGLAVDVVEKLDVDGNMTLTLHNKYNSKGTESTAGQQFTMDMLFGVRKAETTRTKTVNESSEVISATSHRVKGKETVTTITTLTWSLTSIKTNLKTN